MTATSSFWSRYVEIHLVGTLDRGMRRNMLVDLAAACVRSMVTAIILWRSGASTGQMAYYFATTVFGLVAVGLSVRLMRRRGTKPS